MKIELNNEEARLIWIAINNMQSHGMSDSMSLSAVNDERIKDATDEWFKEIVHEFHTMQIIKSKLSKILDGGDKL